MTTSALAVIQQSTVCEHCGGRGVLDFGQFGSVACPVEHRTPVRTALIGAALWLGVPVAFWSLVILAIVAAVS